MMAGSLPGDVSHHGNGTVQGDSQENPGDGSCWYFSKKELEEKSPSKKDGVDLKKETYLRKSYCTFLQDLGMKLKVPQVTIATAIIFCHRFYLRQSIAKNDRRTIATVCMFLAGKVEETPRPLKDVILVAYEIIHKKDPAAVQRIKQKEVYEQQKELILLGERIVLATLGFDLNVLHPYKPLVEAIKKFKVAQNALAQVAWNFVNDGLRTSLCLQFKPHHIAAGAIFLAAKFLKVKLPTDGEKVWWQEFDVTPRQLEEVSNQMLELYEQNRVPPSNDVEEAGGGVAPNRAIVKAPTNNDETATMNSNSQTGAASSRLETSKPAASKTVHESSAMNYVGLAVSKHNRSDDYGSTEMKHRVEDEAKGNQHPEREPLPFRGSKLESRDMVKSGSAYGEEQDSNVKRSEIKEAADLREKQTSRNLDHKDNISGHPPQEAIKKIDRNKVKAALEKRRKASGHLTRNPDIVDDDDLIQRELEDGIELASQNDKNKQDKRQSWSKTSDRSDHKNTYHGRHQDHANEHHHGINGLAFYDPDPSAVEEGELSALDDLGLRIQSPKSINRKRKAGSSPDGVVEGKQQHNFLPGPHNHNRFNFMEDRNKVSRFGQTERDSKRHVQENHV